MWVMQQCLGLLNKLDTDEAMRAAEWLSSTMKRRFAVRGFKPFAAAETQTSAEVVDPRQGELPGFGE